MSKHPGDPTPTSARTVLAGRGYRLVRVDHCPTLQGYLSVDLVVMHCGTETYWRAHYPHHLDGMPMEWEQVEPHVETITIYRTKR